MMRIIKSKIINSDKSEKATIKKYKILLRYYFRNFWRRLYYNLYLFLFVVSIFLFFSIMIPNIFLHQFPIIGEWPRVLELHGSILLENNETGSKELIRVSGATVEIGGYMSTTDNDGKFSIKFVSKSNINIPLIIQWLNTTTIKRVSFKYNEFEKSEVFTLYDHTI